MSDAFIPDELEDITEEEFGSGTEIETTDVLVFGLLSFWMYNVYRFSKLLDGHLNLRRTHFSRLLDGTALPDHTRAAYDELRRKGFSLSRLPAYIFMILYAASMALVLSVIAGMQLTAAGRLSLSRFDALFPPVMGAAAFLFCLSSILFLLWVLRTIKRHEYHELLMLHLFKKPEKFRMVRPSLTFTKRWNKNQNWVAFFLILSIPMTLSPFIASKQIQGVIYAGADHTGLILIWSFCLLGITAVFHFWGTRLLVNMYNGHLRIEAVNRQSTAWGKKASGTVLTDTDENGTSRDTLVPERSLAAILLTDMVGFSRKMEAEEEATYSKLLLHNEIIRSHIKAHNGREIKTIGDAFLVRYASAVDAVRSAMGMQGDLAAHNSGKPEAEQILIRIGIHIGDVLVMDGDVFGNGVNIASRIEPLAEPGGICISADMYNLVKKSIDIQVLSLGRKELKNIREAPEIFKIVGKSLTP
ncbi:MAG: adenylate/guanylate cyclase domain-containing protein [Desulfobacterales bacterium]|nr:adenylate/guanylate cyclase domain-containing protein [Desulfobacterales bacterium]